MSEYAGRVALVTGASGGLGGAVVRHFREAGMNVAGVARRWKDVDGAEESLLRLEADLSLPAGAGETVRETLARFGRMDAVIHLAGGYAGGQRTEDTGEETWERMLAVNLRTAVNMIRAALPVMRSAGGGRMVAVGAHAALDPPAGLSAYTASKAALHAVVRAAAKEVKDAGITVNAVLPTIIDTPANRAAMPGADPSRWVSPAAIASALLWLCSDAAKDVNGALIPIQGRM